MEGNRFRWLLPALTVLLIFLAVAAESLYFSDFEYFFKTRRFNKILTAKEKILEECLNGMKPLLSEDDHHGSITENNLFSLAEKNNITILEFLDNKLIYWSDNGFNVPSNLGDTTYNNNLIFLQNGWFLTRTIEAGNERIVGLLRLHYDYSFENDIIKSGFDKSFGLSGTVGFSTDQNASQFHIKDKTGQFLFSLVFPEVRKNSFLIILPLLLWTTALILIILFLLKVSRILTGKRKYISGLAFLFFSFASI